MFSPNAKAIKLGHADPKNTYFEEQNDQEYVSANKAGGYKCNKCKFIVPLPLVFINQRV